LFRGCCRRNGFHSPPYPLLDRGGEEISLLITCPVNSAAWKPPLLGF
jgi:hypothetical protein